MTGAQAFVAALARAVRAAVAWPTSARRWWTKLHPHGKAAYLVLLCVGGAYIEGVWVGNLHGPWVFIPLGIWLVMCWTVLPRINTILRRYREDVQDKAITLTLERDMAREVARMRRKDES